MTKLSPSSISFFFWMAFLKGQLALTFLSYFVLHHGHPIIFLSFFFFGLFLQQCFLWPFPLVCSLVISFFFFSKTNSFSELQKGSWVMLRPFLVAPGLILYSGVVPWTFLFHIRSSFLKTKKMLELAHQHLQRIPIKKASHYCHCYCFYVWSLYLVYLYDY